MHPRALTIWSVLTLGAALAACGSSGKPAASQHPSTTVRTAPPTTHPKPTSPPTTRWVASAPQSTPDAAAGNLVSDWASGDRAAANQVASPAAVKTLFAAPYPGSGSAIPRGCSSGFPPIVCSFGPPGGGPSSNVLYQLTMGQTTQGWYVSSVTIES